MADHVAEPAATKSEGPAPRREGAAPRAMRAPGTDKPAASSFVSHSEPSRPSKRNDDDPLVAFGSKVRRSTQRRLRVYAAINEQDIQDITDQAIVDWLDKHSAGDS